MSHLGICNHQIDEVNCNEVIKQGWLGSSKDYNFQAIYWLLYVTWYKITGQVSSKNPQLPTSFPGNLPWLLGRLPPLPVLRYCFVRNSLSLWNRLPTCTCENGTSSLTSACSRSARPEDRKKKQGRISVPIEYCNAMQLVNNSKKRARGRVGISLHPTTSLFELRHYLQPHPTHWYGRHRTICKTT